MRDILAGATAGIVCGVIVFLILIFWR